MTRFIFLLQNRNWIWALVITALITATQLRADNSNPGQVARLSSAEGGVRLQQGADLIADPALTNTPIFEGLQLSTAENGKAEIQFQDGSVARLSPNSAMRILSAGGPRGVELAVDGGLTYFEVLANTAQPMRIRLGNTLVTAGAGAIVRLQMDATPAEVAVLAGSVHVAQESRWNVEVENGHTLRLPADDSESYKLLSNIEPDSWDGWNQDRDQALNEAAGYQNDAATSIAGNDAGSPAWNDLDASGSWYDVPDQGYVWSPAVASDPSWEPYGCGHWVWTPRWGYVWVSCEHWGFLPYMCGSWSFYDDFGWGWAPGIGPSCGGNSWNGGLFGGIHVGRVPGWYKIVNLPNPKRPIGRVPMPIAIHRPSPGPGGGLPPRHGIASIDGRRIEPIGRTPGGIGSRPHPGGPGASMIYGLQTNPGSSNRTFQPGFNHHINPGVQDPAPAGGGRSGQPARGADTPQPIVRQPLQPHGFDQPQQPRNFDPQRPVVQQPRMPDSGQQPRNFQQAPQPQHNFQPAPQPQHNFQPAPQPQHFSAPAPSFHMSAPPPPPPSSNSGNHK